MTSICMLMIRKVKNICLFNGYILFLNLLISSFTLEELQKVHKVSNSSAFPGVDRNLKYSYESSTLDTQYQVVQAWSKSFQEEE